MDRRLVVNYMWLKGPRMHWWNISGNRAVLTIMRDYLREQRGANGRRFGANTTNNGTLLYVAWAE